MTTPLEPGESLPDDLIDRIDELLGQARDGQDVAAGLAALPPAARERAQALLAAGLGREPEPTVAGRRVGPYQLRKPLGRGGQASVWLAHDDRLARQVAIKVFHRDVGLSTQGLERIRREALAASRLQHPGICPVHDAGTDGDQHYIVMSWLDGDTLAQRIATWQQRSASGDDTALSVQRIKQVVTIIEQVARAVQAAHAANVVHRDLKPGNIMLLADDRPVVLDFGLAFVGESGTDTLTMTGQVFGTPAYMSPEQVEPSGRRLDARTDVWSLGVALYEALALRRPFDAPTPARLADAILHHEPTSLRGVRGVGPDLAVVVATALEKDLDRRYASMAALADDLRAVLEERPVAARPIGPFARSLRWARRRPAQAALLVVGLLATIGIGGLSGYLLAHQPELQQGADLLRRERIDRLLDVAYFRISQSDSPGAREVFDQVLREEPACYEAVLGHWLARARAGDHSGAKAWLAEHSAHLPQGAAAYLEAVAGDGKSLPVDGVTDPRLLFAAGIAEMLRVPTDSSLQSHARAVNLFTNCLLASRESRRLVLFLRAEAAAYGIDLKTCTQTVAFIERNWPGLPESHYWAGLASLDVDWAGSEAAFRRALELDPKMMAARRQIARLRARAGDRAQALELIGQCIAERPTNGDNHRMAAEIYEILRDPAGVEAASRRTLELDPSNGPAYVMLSSVLMRRGQDAEGLELLRVGAAKSSYPAIQVNLGTALKELGDKAGARACWHKIITDDVRNAQVRCFAHFLLGTLELESGHMSVGFDNIAAALRWQSDARLRSASRWLPPVDDLMATRAALEQIEREYDRWLVSGEVIVRPADAIEIAVRRGDFANALRLAGLSAWPVGKRHNGRVWAAIAAVAASDQAADPAAQRAQAQTLLLEQLRGAVDASGAGGLGVEVTPAEWATVPEFAPVRDPALQRLPEAEQAAWRALWEAAARG